MKKLFLLMIACSAFCAAHAQVVNRSIEQMIADADNIFIGTVDSMTYLKNEKGMPLTKVWFGPVVHSSKSAGENALIYAGGQIGDTIMNVTHTPVFQLKASYLIMSLDNQNGVFNPIVGRYGYLRIIQNSNRTTQFLLSPQGNAVFIENNQFTSSSRQVKSIHNDLVEYEEKTNDYDFPSIPQSNSGLHRSTPLADKPIEKTLLLDEVLDIIEAYGVTFDRKKIISDIPPDSFGNKTTGQGVSYCGYQSLKINMTPMPASFTPWVGLCNDAMWTWNQYMDLFRVGNPSGVFGNNGINEFGGFPSNANLATAYGSGFSWGTGALAMTIYKWTQNCGQILEADVLANPQTRFTNNIWDQVNGQAFMYRNVILHELGHVWGLMDGTQEQYNYDVPTAMHGCSNNYEDGWGIHCVDAELVRKAYSGQTSIISTEDLGVESYYHQNGLRGATLSNTNFKSGDALSIYGLTVENMSPIDLGNVQVHFYFSSDNLINSFDYASPTYYFWTNFLSERYNSAQYTIGVPYNIPSGYYYVGANVTYNGLVQDNFTGNNTTIVPQLVYIQGHVGVENLALNNNISIVPGLSGSQYILKCNEDVGKIVIQDLAGKTILFQDLAKKEITLNGPYGLYVAIIQTPNSNYRLKLPHYAR